MAFTERDFEDEVMGALEIETDTDDARDCADLALDEIDRLRAIEKAARSITHMGKVRSGKILIGPRGFDLLNAALARPSLEVAPSNAPEIAILPPVVSRKRLCVEALAGVPDSALRRAVAAAGTVARLSLLFVAINQILAKGLEG